MRAFIVSASEKDQRLDKYLKRILPNASAGFLQKMLRKKNITRNDRKAEGAEHIAAGDVIKLYFSEETYQKFSGETAGESPSNSAVEQERCAPYRNAYTALTGLKRPKVVYEDEHILVLDKPVGLLSQKAEDKDISANEWLIGYLLEKGEATDNSLGKFKPSVCNRLDRGTGGLLLCGKTLLGTRFLTEQIRDRHLGKFYTAIVRGTMRGSGELTGYLLKDERSNQVSITDTPVRGASKILSVYKVCGHGNGYTEVSLELVTGKSHQLRAQMAYIGHPIAGDRKYGGTVPHIEKELHVNNQLLYCNRVVFPKLSGDFSYLSEKTIEAEPPKIYKEILTAQE